MNTISTDFRFFIEHDANPFILFSNKGAILYLNKSAEMMMGFHVDVKIFDLALGYAPKSFGYRKSLIELSINSFEFYGINVLYENDDELGIHLYLAPREQSTNDIELSGYSQTDINILLQANIELFRIAYQGKLSLMTDYELPELKIHQNQFSMLLRKIFEQFKSTKTLDITMKIKIGAIIIVNQKRYPIIILKLSSIDREVSNDTVIKSMALESHIEAHFENSSITLEIPTIS